MNISNRIRSWLSSTNQAVFCGYATFAAFSVYFCMYAFRKPFSAAAYEGIDAVPLPGLPDLQFKIALIIAQVLGYTLSKFYGIKFISEISPARRTVSLIALIALAEAALILFAIVPAPYSVLCLFLNGFPLGMIWGLVFSFLEGRRFTEALGAGLSVSYIVSSGAVKSVGSWLMQLGVPEFQMPAVTGLVFFPIFLVVVWMLSLVPPPTREDEILRTKREPMYADDRKRFLKLLGPGLFALVFLYMFLTAYRDFRDNFAVELWAALGYGEQPWILTFSEVPITLVVLIVLGLLFLIKSNRLAMDVILMAMLGGSALIGLSTLAYQMGIVGPAAWMILVGLGLYLAYVPYGCILFERMIAAIGFAGTAGFMIYVADAFGYLGSVALLLYKNFGEPNLAWEDFFVQISYVTSIVCVISFVFAFGYFSPRMRAREQEAKLQA